PRGTLLSLPTSATTWSIWMGCRFLSTASGTLNGMAIAYGSTGPWLTAMRPATTNGLPGTVRRFGSAVLEGSILGLQVSVLHRCPLRCRTRTAFEEARSSPRKDACYGDIDEWNGILGRSSPLAGWFAG